LDFVNEVTKAYEFFGTQPIPADINKKIPNYNAANGITYEQLD